MFGNSPQDAQIQRTFQKLNARAMDRRGFMTAAGKLAGAGVVALALAGSNFKIAFGNHAGTTNQTSNPVTSVIRRTRLATSRLRAPRRWTATTSMATVH